MIMPRIEELVQRIPIDNPIIMVSNRRVHPSRPGLEPTTAQLDVIENALDHPERVKGTVSFYSGKDIAYKVQKGKVIHELPKEVQSSMNLPVESSVASESQNQKINTASSQENNVEGKNFLKKGKILSEKLSEGEWVIGKSGLEVQMQPQWLTDLVKQKSSEFKDFSVSASKVPIPESLPELAEPIVSLPASPSGFKIFSFSASESTERENAAAKDMYRKLLTLHPSYSQGMNVERLDFILPKLQQQADKMVAEVALKNRIDRTTFDRILGQGSPYIQAAINSMKPNTQQFIAGHLKPGMSAAVTYQVELSFFYDKSQQALERSIREETERSKVIPVSATVIRDNEIDITGRFESSVGHLAPMQSASIAAHSQSELIIEEVKNRIDMLQTAYKNLNILSASVKEKGCKQWAAEQAPVVQEAVAQIAMDKGEQVKQWAIAKYPGIKAVVQRGAQYVADRARQDISKVATAIDEKIKEIPQEAIAKIEVAAGEAIDLMNAGKSPYSTKQFIFSRDDEGRANVRLNNWDKTPILTNGQINYRCDWNKLDSLQKLPNKVDLIKADVAQQKTAKHYQTQILEV
jgi:hypothetical protein